MSVQAMSWVFDHSESELGARLVALSVANHANKYGRNAWAAVGTYAEEAHLSERQTRYALRKLETELHELRRVGKHGERADRQTTIYEFAHMVDGVQYPPLVEPDEGQSSTERGAESGTDEGQPIAPKPSLNRPEPTTANMEFAFVFYAIKKSCGLGLAELTDREKRKVALATTSIRKTGFEPHSFTAAETEVERRARNYIRRYPGIQITPMALANHWGECDNGPGRREAEAPNQLAWGACSHCGEERRVGELLAGRCISCRGDDPVAVSA